MGRIETQLAARGIVLPEIPRPIGNFVPYRRAGSLLFISGQGARGADGKTMPGRLGADCSVERARMEARQIGLQILASAQAALGSLDRIDRIVRLFGMVNAEPDFTRHPEVIDGCSELLIEILGERGKHARSAVGMNSLPGGIAVEIEAIMLIAEE